MTFARISIALVLILSGTACAVAQSSEDGMANSVGPVAASSIPPNCTLNPFTHTMTCHKWPKGTKSRA